MSWVCPKGHGVDDRNMICPICVGQQSERGLRVAQAEYLRKAAAGTYALRITKLPPRHVMLYQSDVIAFCGAWLEREPRLAYLHYSPETLGTVCPGCRSALINALEEVAAR